jgi:hypothetical protein
MAQDVVPGANGLPGLDSQNLQATLGWPLVKSNHIIFPFKNHHFIRNSVGGLYGFEC